LEAETITQEENTEPQEEDSSENELDGLKNRVGELEKEATAKELKINMLEQKLTEISKQQKETGNRLSIAVNSYRNLITADNAEIPAELISGNSIEEIDNSLMSAKLLVNKIRQGLEGEISAARIPGGAPVRGELDISGLSPIEKIKYAMGRK
jgi:chromosome segregation ATPase